MKVNDKDELFIKRKRIECFQDRVIGLERMFDRIKDVTDDLIEELIDLNGYNVEYHNRIEARLKAALNGVALAFDCYMDEMINSYNNEIDVINSSFSKVLNEAGGEEDE